VLDAIFAYTINGDLFTSEDDYDTAKEIIRSVFRAAIWIPYFLISDRVKKTFVKRWKHYESPALAPINSETEELVFKEEV
jgi:hypothetical protein